MTDLAWIDAALTVGPPAGGRRAAALLPRPRHRRGGLPGGLPARAEELAAERPAARSRRLADLRRAQRRDRRGAAPAQAGAAARRGARSPTSTTPRARSPSGSTTRTTATTSCGCCSSAAIPTCRRPSRSRSRCASSPACRSSRSRAPSWSARARWSSASPAPSAASPRPTCRSRRPGAVERAERLAAVAAMIYLLFNEGYSASGGEAHVRAPLCEEAIRLARLLLRLFPTEPEIMGLTALLLLQHARAPARLDADGAIVLLEDQDRSLWNRDDDRRGAGADRQGDAPPAARALPGAGRDRRAARAAPRGPRTPTGRRSTCSTRALERLQPSPVVTLNRAVAVSKVRGPAAALAMIEPLADAALRLLPLLRRQGRAAAAARPHATRRASPSTAPSRSPTPPPRPRTSACISTG